MGRDRADMAVVELCKQRHGHIVVTAMLRASKNRGIHNVLKASVFLFGWTVKVHNVVFVMKLSLG